MTKAPVQTSAAPAAIGPYSQGMRADPFLFTAGQIGLRDGQLVDGVEAQTRQVLSNLRAVLEAGGSSLGAVVKTTIFLIDMADFDTVNRVYAEHFSGDYPARSTVAVAALPKGARVEIEAIAITGG
ncbi:MAG TPA: RidA family protein [Candidatus Xenobia bacterium]|jgi:2-iminobutanoate/2-iminopropanoate deaminase